MFGSHCASTCASGVIADGYGDRAAGRGLESCELPHGCFGLRHGLARVRRIYATPNAQLAPAPGWPRAGPALGSIAERGE